MFLLKVALRSFMLPLFLGMLLFSNVVAQDAYYYGKTYTESFYYATDRLVLKLSPDTTMSAQEITSLDPAFDTSRAPEPNRFGFFTVYLLSGSDVNTCLNRLKNNSAVEIANPVYISTITGENIAFDRVSVKFQDSITRNTIDSMNIANQVSIIDSVYGISNYYILKISKQTGKNVMEIANIYSQSPITVFAVPSFLINIRVNLNPPDRFFLSHQWYFNNIGQFGGTPDADIDADSAWDLELGDPAIIVADIDMGVKAHKDLPQSRLVAGYDAVGNDVTDSNNAPDFDPSPGDCQDVCWHGMATTGLIAASQDTIGITGLAPNIKIMPVKIWDNFGGGGYAPEVASAISWAHFHGAYILSNSYNWTGVCDSVASGLEEVKFAIKFVTQLGQLVIFSAGNSDGGCVEFPANLKEVIAVGATDKFDNRSSFSPAILGPGDSLDLVAGGGSPSWDVLSLDIMGSGGYNNGDYMSFAGTSAACPQVAGVAALLLSYAIRSNCRTNLAPPNNYVDDYKKILRFSTDDKGPVGWDASYGQGRLNAMKAMVEVARGDVTKDNKVLLPDVVFLKNYIFSGGPAPTPLRSLGDANCDGNVSQADMIYLNNFIFKGGPPPAIHCYRFY